MHSMQGPKPELGVPWYGTRYGHNLAEQVNQHMLYCTVLYYTILYLSSNRTQRNMVKLAFIAETIEGVNV